MMEAQLLDPGKKSRRWRPSIKKLFQRGGAGGKKNKLPDGDLKYFPDFDKQDRRNNTTTTIVMDMESQEQDHATLDLSHASGSADSSPRCGSGVSSMSQRGYSDSIYYFDEEEELSLDDDSTSPPSRSATKTKAIVASILMARNRSSTSNRSNKSTKQQHQQHHRAPSPVPMVRKSSHGDHSCPSAPLPRMNSSSSAIRRRLILSSTSNSNSNMNKKKHNSFRNGIKKISFTKQTQSNLFDAPFVANDAYAPCISYDDEEEEDILRYNHHTKKQQHQFAQLQAREQARIGGGGVSQKQQQSSTPRSSHFWRSSSTLSRQPATIRTQSSPLLMSAGPQWRSRSLNSNLRPWEQQQHHEQQQQHLDADVDEQGTEVILFQSDREVNSLVGAGDFLPDPDDFLEVSDVGRRPYDDDEEAAGDAIFLSLQTTTTPLTTIEVPFDCANDKTPTTAADMATFPEAQPRWSHPAPDREVPRGKFLPQPDDSPTSSKFLTWVFNEQEEDERPVKEIVFPTLLGTSLQKQQSMEKEQQQQRLGSLLDRAVNRSREQVRDAIFASLEQDDDDNVHNVSDLANRSTDRDNNKSNYAEDEIIFERQSYSDGSPSFDMLFDDMVKDEFDDENSFSLNKFGSQPNNMKASSFQKGSAAPRSPLSSSSSKQQLQRQQQQHEQQQLSPLSESSKKHMSTQGPENKNKGRVQDMSLVLPSSTELPPASTPRHKNPSAAFLKRKSAFTGDDLLSQEAESFAEFLEDAGATDISRIDQDTSLEGIISTTSQERFLSAISAADMDDDGFPSLNTTIDSKLNRDVFVSVVDRSSGNKNPHQRPMSALSGVTTSIRSTSQTSAPLISKSLSYDTSESRTSTHNTGDDFSQPTSAKATMYYSSQAPYCGGIVFSSAEDDDFTSDRSEDYSSVYSKKTKNKSALEELQLDVLSAVQDLARSASSNMMKFLHN